MMAQSIYEEITSYLATNFGTDKRIWWYVGIANNIEQRLFSDHNVDRNSKAWIWRKAYSAGHARSAEASLLQLGYDGGSGGGSQDTLYVYAFRKNQETVR